MEDRPVTLQIPLTYDVLSGEGTLTDLNVKVLINDKNPSGESIRFAMTRRHKNFLPCYFGGTEENITYAVYEAASETLETHLSRLGPSIETYTIPAKDGHGNVVVANLCSSTYIPNCYRRIMADMVGFLHFLYHENKSIDNPIKAGTHIRVLEGEIIFFGLDLIEKTEESEKLDYSNIMFAIHEIIHIGMLLSGHPPGQPFPEMPADFKDLQSLMNNFRAADRYLISNHLAILSPTDRLFCIKKFQGTSYVFRKNKTAYDTALRKIKRTPGVDWRSRFMNMDYSLGPALSCFRWSTRHANNLPYSNNNSSLLTFCRNMAEHMNQHFEYYKLDFSDMDLDLTIMTLFAPQLLSFQKQASRSGILMDLYDTV